MPRLGSGMPLLQAAACSSAGGGRCSEGVGGSWDERLPRRSSLSIYTSAFNR